MYTVYNKSCESMPIIYGIHNIWDLFRMNRQKFLFALSWICFWQCPKQVQSKLRGKGLFCGISCKASPHVDHMEFGAEQSGPRSLKEIKLQDTGTLKSLCTRARLSRKLGAADGKPVSTSLGEREGWGHGRAATE